MRPDDYDLAGFTVGVVDRPKMIDPANVAEGDVIIGLPSTGVHSNGYTLVRKVIGVDGIVPGTPEAEAKKAELESIEVASGLTLADALLAPTRITATLSSARSSASTASCPVRPRPRPRRPSSSPSRWRPG